MRPVYFSIELRHQAGGAIGEGAAFQEGTHAGDGGGLMFEGFSVLNIQWCLGLSMALDDSRV